MNIRRLFENNFPISSTEYVPSLESFFSEELMASQEGFVEFFKNLKSKIFSDKPRLWKRDLDKVIKAYYSNQKWLDTKTFRDGEIKASDIAKYIHPATDVTSVSKLTKDTVTEVTKAIARFEKELKDRDQRLAPVIKILKKGTFNGEVLKEVQALLDKIDHGYPKVEFKFPLGELEFNSKKSPKTVGEDTATLKALTKEEVVEVARNVEALVTLADKLKARYEDLIKGELYNEGRNEDWALYEYIREIEPEQRAEAEGWNSVAGVFYHDVYSLIHVDVIKALVDAAYAQAKWIDRSIK